MKKKLFLISVTLILSLFLMSFTYDDWPSEAQILGKIDFDREFEFLELISSLDSDYLLESEISEEDLINGEVSSFIKYIDLYYKDGIMQYLIVQFGGFEQDSYIYSYGEKGLEKVLTFSPEVMNYFRTTADTSIYFEDGKGFVLHKLYNSFPCDDEGCPATAKIVQYEILADKSFKFLTEESAEFDESEGYPIIVSESDNYSQMENCMGIEFPFSVYPGEDYSGSVDYHYFDKLAALTSDQRDSIKDISKGESGLEYFSNLTDKELRRLKFAISILGESLNVRNSGEFLDYRIPDSELIPYIGEAIICMGEDKTDPHYRIKELILPEDIGEFSIGGISETYSVKAEVFRKNIKDIFDIDLENRVFPIGEFDSEGKEMTYYLNDEVFKMTRPYWYSETHIAYLGTLLRDIKVFGDYALATAYTFESRIYYVNPLFYELEGPFYVLLEKGVSENGSESIYPIYVSRKAFEIADAEKNLGRKLDISVKAPKQEEILEVKEEFLKEEVEAKVEEVEVSSAPDKKFFIGGWLLVLVFVGVLGKKFLSKNKE